MNIMLTQQEGGLADFPHLEMFGCVNVRRLGSMPLLQHQNPGIEICTVYKGRFDWMVEGRPVLALPGTATVTFPWQAHGGTRAVMDIGELSWLILKPDQFTPDGAFRAGRWSSLPAADQSYISRQLLGAPQPLVLAKNTAVRDCFREINAELCGQRPGRVWRVNRWLDELLLSLARSVEQAAQDSARTTFDMSAIERAVRSDPSRRWTLDDLCRLSGWSKSALNPRIKEATGYSTMEYVLSVRLKIAQERLAETDQPVTDMAFDLGFSSSQHFSASFRQRIGLPPTEFRRAHRR